MAKYRFKGHESFILRDGWLTKGLVAVHDDPQVFSRNKGADALGVGTNMANAIRYWLMTAGWIMQGPGRSGYVLTDIGNLVYEKDRYVEDIFTLWLFHVDMTRNFEQATTWNVFFNDFEAQTFTRKDMIRTVTEKCYELTGAEALPESSIENDCAAILQMYCGGRQDSDDPEDRKVSPFAALGLIMQDKNTYERTKPDLETIEDQLIYYLIQDKLSENGNLAIDEIVSGKNMPGKLLGLKRVAVNDILDRLSDAGMIIVNRTAGLDMVYKNSDDTAIDILSNYFERKASI